MLHGSDGVKTERTERVGTSKQDEARRRSKNERHGRTAARKLCEERNRNLGVTRRKGRNDVQVIEEKTDVEKPNVVKAEEGKPNSGQLD